MLLEKNKTQIKIIDFGISRKLRPNEPTKETFGTPEFVGKCLMPLASIRCLIIDRCL